MITVDLHTHTCASHGQARVAEMLQAAREQKFAVYGFSEHSPRPQGYDYNPDYREHLQAAFPNYVQEVLTAKADPELPQVLLGMELDWLPAEMPFMQQAVADYPFDYIIGGIHFLGQWGFDAKSEDWKNLTPEQKYANYVSYYTAMKNMAHARYNGTRLVDIVAHPDLIKIFSVDTFHQWLAVPAHKHIVAEALQAINDANMVLEISSAGLRKPCAEIYPHPVIMSLAADIGLNISFASDAHDTKTLGYAFDQLAAYARTFGYTESCYFVNRTMHRRPF